MSMGAAALAAAASPAAFSGTSPQLPPLPERNLRLWQQLKQ